MKVGCQIRGLSGSRRSLKSDMGHLWRWIVTTFSFLQKLSFGSLRLSISTISHGIRESRIGRSYPHLGTYLFFGVLYQKRIPFQCWVKTNLANFDDQSYPHLVTHLFLGYSAKRGHLSNGGRKLSLANFDDLLAVAWVGYYFSSKNPLKTLA
jgi:hypothetical protein